MADIQRSLYVVQTKKSTGESFAMRILERRAVGSGPLRVTHLDRATNVGFGAKPNVSHRAQGSLAAAAANGGFPPIAEVPEGSFPEVTDNFGLDSGHYRE
jgi:hypothetical protein